MNYEKIYQQLIDRAITRTLTGYKERHHIVPKCMGGDNSKLNLVDLTAREHFIAHKLLCKIYPTNKGIQLALWAMVNWNSSKNQREYKVSSREYGRLRLEVIEIIRETQLNRVHAPHSTETKQKISNAHTGKKKSKEHLENLSKSLKGNIAWNKGKTGVQKHSAETKEKMRLSHLGKTRKPHSEETKQLLREQRLGKASTRKNYKHSEETKQKIRQSKLNKKTQL
jgi:hypothetical protein